MIVKPVIIEIKQNPQGFYVIPYRGDLNTKIVHSGYDNIAEFCKSQGISHGTMSGIIRGWVWPSPEVQKKLCFALALSQTELLKLLGVKM